MQVKYCDKDLEELIFTGNNSKYKKYSRDKRFMKGLAQVYTILQVVANAEGLRPYSYLHYEKLANNVNLSSVRILNGRVERLLFKEINDGIEITIIELNTTHYGNKK
jgi:plasmid maintenance system killer protein